MRRALVVGTGLIGGSIGLALRALGWHVTGSDIDAVRSERAYELGAIDEIGDDPDAEITFIAVPVSKIVELSKSALARLTPTRKTAVVTDVGSVKSSIVDFIDHPCFIGGHPMAGSEAIGIEGANEHLFQNATWVLTPTANTDYDAYFLLRETIESLGSSVLELTPSQHDSVVAVVSHVPYLLAVSLMNIATRKAQENIPLLKLAAGGFKDMTRIAGSDPTIWPDICAQNSNSIARTLDDLLNELVAIRDDIAKGDRETIMPLLSTASLARRSLPSLSLPPSTPHQLTEIRIPVEDRLGVLAEVTTLAASLGVNIEDITIVSLGVLSLIVDQHFTAKFVEELKELGYLPIVYEVLE